MKSLDKDKYLEQLNMELQNHDKYELGMKFLNIDDKGFHLCDPRQLQLLRGERKNDFSDSPFADAIYNIKSKYELLL